MTDPLHTVHLRVNDVATGQPTPVRLRITDSAGVYYPPFGRLRTFATGIREDVGGNVLVEGRSYAYVDGSCEIPLPPGVLAVEAVKGIEYDPSRQELALQPGKLAIRFALERWMDSRKDRWYAGDTRCHFLSPHAALLEAGAEDLAVVNLLAAEVSGQSSASSTVAIPQILSFSGQRPALENSGHMVVVNTHNRHPILGSLALLNCHRVVYPLRFGQPGSLDDWTLADWCDQCHRKGGLVIWTPTEIENESFPLGEAVADVILGKIDALEVSGSTDRCRGILKLWYRLLQSGARLPLAGASAKTSNSILLGGVRTYARLLPDEDLTYKNWIEAIRSGRTFITNGPLLSFNVNSFDPGAVLSGPASPIHLRAEARSLDSFDRLEIIMNGAVILTAEPTGSPSTAALEQDIPLTQSGWLAARCRSSSQGKDIVAHTSPIYIEVEDRVFQSDPCSVSEMFAQIDRMTAWVDQQGRFSTDIQKNRLMRLFTDAQSILGKTLTERPFSRRGGSPR